MDCRQALIARYDRAFALTLNAFKELADGIGREVFDVDIINRRLFALGNKWHELRKRVSIALLRILRKVSLNDDVFNQEPPNPGGDQILAHGDIDSMQVLPSTPFQPERYVF